MIWGVNHAQESGANQIKICTTDYRVHLEEDQRVRSLKLPLGAYSTESSAAAVGAWFFLDTAKRGRADGGCGQNSQLGGSADAGKPAVSNRGRTLTPNSRNVDDVP